MSTTHILLTDSEVLRATDVSLDPDSGVLFPVPADLVGLTVSAARSSWCGDLIDDVAPNFYRPQFVSSNEN